MAVKVANPFGFKRLGCATYLPSLSWMVAYWEFASGHEVRLHSPVTLYWLRQKVDLSVFVLKEQKRWLITYAMHQQPVNVCTAHHEPARAIGAPAR